MNNNYQQLQTRIFKSIFDIAVKCFKIFDGFILNTKMKICFTIFDGASETQFTMTSHVLRTCKKFSITKNTTIFQSIFTLIFNYF